MKIDLGVNILVTGSKGFVGQNLVASLKNIQQNKDRTRNISIDNIYKYDIDTDVSLLDEYCKDCDFVFNLAGVNRPKDNKEFMEGNFGFASTLLDTLKQYNNKAPIMLSSSIQATLLGRYAGSDYGKSKLAGEELFLIIVKKLEVKFLYTVFQTCLENGVDQTITVQLQPSVITMLMIYQYKSMILM